MDDEEGFMTKIVTSFLFVVALAMVLSTSWAIAAAATLTDVTWTLGAAIPEGHQEAAVATHDTLLYVISGTRRNCAEDTSAVPTKAVEIYNAETNQFHRGPSVNFARTESPLAARVGDNIFLIGGTSSCAGPTETAVEELNLTTRVWSVLPSSSDLPAPLDGAYHCGALVGTNIYYFQSAGIGVFDTTTFSWSVLAASPLLTPSNYCQATAVGGFIGITGPGDGTPDANSQRVLNFNTTTDSLTQKTELTTVPFAEHVAIDLDGMIVAAGGEFRPRTVQGITPSSVTRFSSLPVPSSDAVGARIKSIIYIAGGNNGTTNKPQVLIGTPVP
jgi:Kelch motif